MRRLIVVSAGVLLAFAGSSVALVVGVLAEAVSLPAQASLGMAWITAALQVFMGGSLGLAMSALWTALVTACFVPVCLVAVIGEAAGLRSFVWAAGGTGVVTAAMPSLMRSLAALDPGGALSAGEGRFTILLFLIGTVAGTTYWLVAGARTGGAR